MDNYILIGIVVTQFCLIWWRLGRLEGRVNHKLNDFCNRREAKK